jgi:hypothetical protein
MANHDSVCATLRNGGRPVLCVLGGPAAQVAPLTDERVAVWLALVICAAGRGRGPLPMVLTARTTGSRSASTQRPDVLLCTDALFGVRLGIGRWPRG